MNYEEFQEKYSHDENGKTINQHTRISIRCNCGRDVEITRWRAEANIKRNKEYVCASCAMKKHHERNPRGEETREKQRVGRLGKKHTEEAKKKMSSSKLEFYETPKGKKVRKRLSALTAKGHSQNKYENSKRQGWYLSKKAGEVFYGSSYELRLLWELDRDDSVETYQTQLYYEVDDRGRCLDCLVTYKDGVKKLIEMKPSQRLNEEKNISQINDACNYAKTQGWDFALMTEEDLGMTYKEICDWADEFRSETSNIDWKEIRKKHNREKVNRHYNKNIAQDKVEVYCEFCQDTHTPLRLTYEKNIKRNNGKYICERYGGYLVGKKPGNKKDNPYAAEGKKKCNRCEEVKLFEEFGVDKTKTDGYSTRCKKCRSEVAMEKYNRKKGKI